MKSSSKQLIISAAVIIFGLAAIYVLSNFLTASRPPSAAEFEDEDLALQGAKLKGFTLGFDGLIADWYWMQSLQYIGGKILKNDQPISLDNLKSLNPRLLYPYLDNATTLDPHFIEAYSYGAIVLPSIDNEQAIKIAQKGIDNNPDEWRLYQYLGYIYWRSNNFPKAAEIYSRGAAVKDAPPFLKLMAAKMNGEGGSRETARAIYSQMFEEAQDSQTKDNARFRLDELDSLDEREAIQQALQSFKAKNNHCANNWSEILPLLLSVKLPDGKDFRLDKSNNLTDPSGAPYLLKNTDGKCDVALDFTKTKIPAN